MLIIFLYIKENILNLRTTLCLLLAMICLNSCSMLNINIDEAISVEVKMLNDSWEITYTLPFPVKKIAFYENSEKLRQTKWMLTNKRIKFKYENNKEYLISKTPFKKFTINHKTYAHDYGKSYEHFFKFNNDNGIILYSGYYNLNIKNKDGNITPHKFKFTPSNNSNVIVESIMSESPVFWNDYDSKGTFAYFGKLNIEKFESFSIINDPSLPKWIQNKSKEIMANIIRYYTKKLKFDIDFTPLIYLTFTPNIKKTSSLEYTGNLLSKNIELNLTGDRWNKYSSTAHKKLFIFIAHEFAHIWNAELFKYKNKGQLSWMHEGSAEMFAYQAALDFNIISKKDYINFVNNNSIQCLLSTRSNSINRSENEFESYTCGVAIGSLTKAIIQKSKHKVSIMDFWSAIFRKSQDNKNIYDQKTYFEVLSKYNIHTDEIEKLKDFIDNKQPNISNNYKSILQATDVKLEPDTNQYSNYYKQVIRVMLVKELMKQDCGFFSIYHREKFSELEGSKHCKSFKKNFKLSQINNINIINAPIKAYDYAREKCNQMGEVSVFDIKNKSISVKCNNISARPYIVLIKDFYSY